MNGWVFDPYSALAGAGAMLLLVGIGYFLGDPFVQTLQKLSDSLSGLLGWFTAGIEDQYREAVEKRAQQAHILAKVAPLEAMFVPPRLIPPPLEPDPAVEDSPVRESLSLGMALMGHNRLLVIGGLASGRTTLLSYLALVHAQEKAGATLGMGHERLPIYIDLSQVDWSPLEKEKRAPKDSDVLIGEAIRWASGPSGAKSKLAHHLQAGTALVLFDEWEALDFAQRELFAAWLERLADALEGNIWLVATGLRGYSLLTDAVFVPLKLEPWERSQVASLVSRYADALPIAEPVEEEPVEERAKEPPEEWVQEPTESVDTEPKGEETDLEDWGELYLEGAKSDQAPEVAEQTEAQRKAIALQWATDALVQAWETGALPFDLALRAWLLVTQRKNPVGRLELFLLALAQLLDLAPGEQGAWLSETASMTFGRLALAMLQENKTSVTKKEIENTLDAVLDSLEDRPSRAASQVMRLLTSDNSPLISLESNRYLFSHPFWQACLAAQQIVNLPFTTLLEVLDDPRWLPAFDFYAEIGNMESLVEAWLEKPDDLWRTRLCVVAHWAAVAPANTPWRNKIMAPLARAFLDTTLPTWVRDRLVKAMVRTNDPGVPLFLRQALNHPQEIIRKAAALAMGQLRERADLNTLMGALNDPVEAVQTAAAVALGYVGTEEAVHLLARVLAEGEEILQVELARGLARSGESGHQVLQDLVEAPDLLVRRAAVYGLGEVGASWARDLLDRVVDEDQEWVVRSAATAILTETETIPSVQVDPPPLISEMGWLIAWAAEQGEGVGKGEAALIPLQRALKEGDSDVRRAAAQALGLVGRPEHIAPLRQAVNDPVPEVAHTAFWALEELTCRYDRSVQ